VACEAVVALRPGAGISRRELAHIVKSGFGTSSIRHDRTRDQQQLSAFKDAGATFEAREWSPASSRSAAAKMGA